MDDRSAAATTQLTHPLFNKPARGGNSVNFGPKGNAEDINNLFLSPHLFLKKSSTFEEERLIRMSLEDPFFVVKE